MFELIDEWGPEKVVCVSDARTGMRGVLVVDNTARGMGKGGTRMSTTVSVGEVAHLARNMTWKWAGVDLFYGGAKAGIWADPNAESKEAVLRAFVRALENEVPEEYVFGLDVGLTEKDAAIMLDEVGGCGGAVGTPHALGGLPYDQLGVTGHGVAESADAAAQAIGLSTSSLSLSIQGFGAVGAATAERLAELEATVVAVSTSHGGIHNPDGLDVTTLVTLRGQHGDGLVAHYSDAKPLAAGEELSVTADILVPAARQDVIDADLARTLPAKIIVEGANYRAAPKPVGAARTRDQRGSGLHRQRRRRRCRRRGHGCPLHRNPARTGRCVRQHLAQAARQHHRNAGSVEDARAPDPPGRPRHRPGTRP
jgi:glutamate dehydrogenase (NAD(P)+)